MTEPCVSVYGSALWSVRQTPFVDFNVDALTGHLPLQPFFDEIERFDWLRL